MRFIRAERELLFPFVLARRQAVRNDASPSSRRRGGVNPERALSADGDAVVTKALDPRSACRAKKSTRTSLAQARAVFNANHVRQEARDRRQEDHGPCCCPQPSIIRAPARDFCRPCECSTARHRTLGEDAIFYCAPEGARTSRRAMMIMPLRRPFSNRVKVEPVRVRSKGRSTRTREDPRGD